MTPVYLDSHATTPVLPEVFEAMKPYFVEHFGNPNSEHAWGWKATAAIAKAKKQIAQLVQCDPSQVFTTGGATESIHWVFMGWSRKNPRGRILTTATEHKATYGASEWAEILGVSTEVLPVHHYGELNLEALEKALNDDNRPTLLSLIHGNNEIGTLNPVAQVSPLKERFPHLMIHLDAAQSVGKVPVDFANWNLDFLSLSGHKLYAPKGSGALIIKDSQSIAPLFLGGGQQQGLRAGTLNVPGIVGLGAASQWCYENLSSERTRLEKLRDHVIQRLTANPRVVLNGHPSERLPHNLNFTFQGLSLDKLLVALPGVAFSASSACSSSSATPSHVLKAIGLETEAIRSTLRFGLSHDSTRETLDGITDKILETLEKDQNWLSS